MVVVVLILFDGFEQWDWCANAASYFIEDESRTFV